MIKKSYIISIDQSTSSTKALLFDEEGNLLARTHVDHHQYYPQEGWVEHDAEEIYDNMVKAIGDLTLNGVTLRNSNLQAEAGIRQFSISITNQRETVVVWNKETGKPIANAVVWQDTRGAELCRRLRQDEKIASMVMEKSGLLLDPNFSASGVRWLLDHVANAENDAQEGRLLLGTIDTWLIWKLTEGKTFATDTTNASRTMLFNIHTMQWDDDLLRLFNIPRSMMPEVLPCDAIYGETTVEGLFKSPITIAGVLGDSHGALVGQTCFREGLGKVTYGTGSSVMINIGQQPLYAPKGLVTSVAFSAFGKHFYAYEGNIYSTGATLKWMADQLQLVGHPAEMEQLATSVPDNGGVYIVPAFSGLGAPWWQSDVKAAIVGLTFASTKAHVVRAALESIAYQIKDLVDVMRNSPSSSESSSESAQGDSLFADGGPTKNEFLMQFQADMLQTPIVCTEVDDASALGAVMMNGFARGIWKTTDDVTHLRKVVRTYTPHDIASRNALYEGWLHAVRTIT